MTGTFVPVIPRNLRLEVSERVEASGAVRTPLDEDEVKAAVEQLLAAGCESLVIHFLHSYANPAHERRAAEIAQKLWPNGYITTGHSLLSEAREFERGVTASVNASVQPILERYVHRLRERAGAAGLPARLPDHERQWRHDLGAFRRARCGQDRDVRPGLGRHRRRLYGQARRLPEPRHLRHGRHLDRRGADPRRRTRRLQRDRDRICHADPCADGRRAHGRRRRRLDRARRCVRPDPGRPGKRRRQSRPRLLRPRRHGADHHRRQPAARPARPEAAARGRRAGDGRAGEEDFRGEDRPRRRPRRGRCRGRGAAGSATSRWPARSAWSRCPGATIPGISRFLPSAAQARCMRRRWRANSACRPCWCRRVRASPTRSAASSPTSATTSSTRSTSRCRCSTKPGCATSCSTPPSTRARR